MTPASQVHLLTRTWEACCCSLTGWDYAASWFHLPDAFHTSVAQPDLHPELAVPSTPGRVFVAQRSWVRSRHWLASWSELRTSVSTWFKLRSVGMFNAQTLYRDVLYTCWTQNVWNMLNCTNAVTINTHTTTEKIHVLSIKHTWHTLLLNLSQMVAHLLNRSYFYVLYIKNI